MEATSREVRDGKGSLATSSHGPAKRTEHFSAGIAVRVDFPSGPLAHIASCEAGVLNPSIFLPKQSGAVPLPNRSQARAIVVNLQTLSTLRIERQSRQGTNQWQKWETQA
ncbi:hypothetical protein ACCO45_003875 [Purpureocillium lilacinum]